MAMLTGARDTKRKDSDLESYPVKGGAKVQQGGMAAVDANGLLQPASDTAGLKFVGISRYTYDNTNGADGAMTGEVWREGVYLLDTGQDMTAHIGEIACVIDDHTVDLAAVAAHDVPVGAISKADSATQASIDIKRRA